MQYRAHLFSLRIANALRESCIKEPYHRARFIKDLMAGATVGIIAIPLAMALAIASGVAPQYGLYTAIIAGFIIPMFGGSRFSISGPTAAFVVILVPITEQFGLAGLLMASFLAGFILIGLALARLGRFIEYIPESITLGFTSGIAIVIATLQIKDFFGLDVPHLPGSYLEKVMVLMRAFDTWDMPSTLIATTTFLSLWMWRQLKFPIPPHLIAVLIGTGVSLILTHMGYTIDTIGSRFTYALPDGRTGHGIPPFLPSFEWPWLQTGPDGHPLTWNKQTFQALLPSAFSIAMLGAIESLLCAMVLDGMTGKRHSANSELLGQGLGNIMAPFFGGISATAAIARSAANVKAGAESPISSMIHALVVLMGLLVLGPWLSYLPMASMAALLIMVAWSMSEAHKVFHLIKRAPFNEVFVLILCAFLTVFFDMVVAITVGLVLSAFLFIREISEMTKITDISENRTRIHIELPKGWRVIKINGPLFFAPADRVFSELAHRAEQCSGLVIYMDAVPILDAGGVSAMQKFIDKCMETKTNLIFADFQSQPRKTLERANVKPIQDVCLFTPTLHKALEILRERADKETV